MCGIYGYYDRAERSLSEEALDRMAHALRHRGPDDHGRFHAPGVALANTRLSIIDLACGHQPMASEDGQVQLVQNGEIYNFIELRESLGAERFRTQSDTEVLLRAYLSEGPEFVQRLNGMFAIAIYDARDRTLRLFRDRVGVKPLYLYEEGTRLLFASEIKALLRGGAPARLSPEGLHHFLTFSCVPPPYTMFEGIRHLPPGHWMEIGPHGTRLHRWWNLAGIQPESRSVEAWVQAFRDLLDDSVRLRLRADVPFGAFLSGGLDSSSVVAAMSRHLPAPVKTFSIGFHDARYDESPFSQEVAEKFGTDHVLEKVEPNLVDLWPRAVYHCDQPHADVSYLPMLRLSELAVRHVKMVLTGDGGDELFGGYQRYADFFARPEVLAASDETFRQLYHQNCTLLYGEDAKRALYTPQLLAATEGFDSFDVTRTVLESVHTFDRINQALAMDTLVLLPMNNLVKPDRTTMAVSLEGRDPFLDPRLIELAFQMPGELKIRDGQTRWLYKQAVERDLGPELTHRKKQMFTVPIGEWFKRELRPFTEGLLLSERSLDRGLFRPEAIRQTLHEHQAETQNRTREIRGLIALELWHRIFLDDSFDHAPSFEEIGLEPALTRLASSA